MCTLKSEKHCSNLVFIKLFCPMDSFGVFLNTDSQPVFLHLLLTLGGSNIQGPSTLFERHCTKLFIHHSALKWAYALLLNKTVYSTSFEVSKYNF